MARWKPGAAERLQRAALELFTSQGFEQTTTTEIARAVGLTERTFFRHFADKREVLFYGQDEFVAAFLTGLHEAPPDAAPMAAVAAAVHSGASLFPEERRPFARMRQAVIHANPALQERERHKLARLAESIAAELRARGVGELEATLAAEAGATVFGVSFTQWIREGEQRSMADIAAEVFRTLVTLTRTEAAHPA